MCKINRYFYYYKLKIAITAIYVLLVPGIVTNVKRDCIGGAIDHDTSTDQIPGEEQCVSEFDAASENADITTCYLPCDSSDGCNNQNIGKGTSQLSL